ncbi:MAG: peptidylprolyl isomerase [Pseudohongiellaceae bacterium]
MLRNLLDRILPALLLVLASLAAPASKANSVVCVESSLGNFCIELFDDVAPQTVQNFLNYVRGGDYNNTFIHRSVPGFVIQGGGYYYTGGTTVTEVPKDAPVRNEFNRSNLRGTIAMAKFGNDPNSATSEWFINLGNNAANLDGQNGGFTVFGQVVGNGMAVVDAMAARTARDLSFSLGGAFTDVPVLKIDSQLSADDFITITRMYEADPDDLPDDTTLPDTTGIFNGSSFIVPLQYRGRLYRVIFDLSSTPPVYEFAARTTQIVLMKDVGQEKATFDGSTLAIPSITYGTTILKNLVFELIDPRTLEFKLVSYQLN